MRLVKLSMAAVAALSMATTPVLAQAASPASKLSVTKAASVSRTGAPVSDASNARGGFIIPAIAVIAIILGILAATGGDDKPSSP